MGFHSGRNNIYLLIVVIVLLSSAMQAWAKDERLRICQSNLVSDMLSSKCGNDSIEAKQ